MKLPKEHFRYMLLLFFNQKKTALIQMIQKAPAIFSRHCSDFHLFHSMQYALDFRLLILPAWDLLFLHDSLQHVKVIPVLVLRVSYVRFYLNLPKILIVPLHLVFILLRGSAGGCAPHSFLSTKRTEVTVIPKN
ncbi:hypothetical protein ALC62_07383 [Cyphomyrmex costatus]|uniref:Uncharacterized protein n=1 Tax=Cyphomyrmex costatus TaxID=456900 RepID=A0A151IHT0_9HYME|nr:hypothetical protein ALC62_07383 [Cyphomyrmex costatus]